MSTLYVVATPIGNLEDITQRALRILREVHVVAAEDTRKTKRLFNAYDIKTRLVSYHKHSPQSKLYQLLGELEQHDIAIVSEAGTPAISDPGHELIKMAVDRSISIVCVPGPSAVITALVSSGLPTDRFLFLGFPPRKSGEKKQLLREIKGSPYTIIIFESPHRFQATLKDILSVLGDRKISVGRELTKLHEEIFRGTISEALHHFERVKGEFTLVVEGNPSPNVSDTGIDVEEELNRLYSQGASARDAIAEVAALSGVSKSTLYQTWLRVSGDQ
ncbi:MAG: 16S rRNA (cytidine(1402)-2'-O)-methyltransferase [Chloroflexota bacterium]|nr:16S rRNA (cytidine(1402)-2'-O)-methyltransferase [Chloroflexota bacterium]